MADGESSPFPTTHDSLGMSSILTPRFIPSSPPSVKYSKPANPTQKPTKLQKDTPVTGPSDGEDSESHLSDYTIDFSKLPGGAGKQKKIPASQAHENDNLSELGGPEDFTENLVELLRSRSVADCGDTVEIDSRDGDDLDGLPTQMGPDEISEIEPPLDMSTPIHITSRGGSFNEREVAAEPSQFGHDTERLQKEIQQKDRIIADHERQILNSSRHFQVELQREHKRHLAESSSKNQQIREFEDLLMAKDEQLKQTRCHLQQLQAEVEQSRSRREADMKNDQIFHLEKQLQEKHMALQETKVKLNEVVTSQQNQVLEKVAENDRLQAMHEKYMNETDSLIQAAEDGEHNVKSPNSENLVHQLESQLAESQKATLDAKTEIISKLGAVKNLAARLSLEVEGKEFEQILDLIASSYLEAGSAKNDAQMEKSKVDQPDVWTQLQEANARNRILTVQVDTLREELRASRSAFSTLMHKNSQVSRQLGAYNSRLMKFARALKTLTQRHEKSLKTAHELEKKLQEQEESRTTTAEILDEHEMEIDSLVRSHDEEMEKLRDTHESELATLRDTHADANRSLHALLRTSQDREAESQSELLELRKLLSSKSEEIATLMTEKEKLESIIEAKDATSVAVDEKFVNVLKKREKAWESRLSKLMDEKQQMSKVLMWTLGEKEIGPAAQRREGQGYKYKYVDRPQNSR